MENFNLKNGEEFIELKNLIKLLGWVNTGSEAMSLIDNRAVSVNGEIETQRRKKIRKGDMVTSGTHQVRVA
jgi:ribosome-associated protein